jgi:hypothetical protein
VLGNLSGQRLDIPLKADIRERKNPNFQELTDLRRLFVRLLEIER